MTKIVVLGSGLLGLLARRKEVLPAQGCRQWQKALLASGVRVVLPEITEFEVRRELLRINSLESILRLDRLSEKIEYLPIATAAMRLAAVLWAQGRKSGQPMADPKELDGDVILAAQTILFGEAGTVTATTNVGHLTRYAAALHWKDV